MPWKQSFNAHLQSKAAESWKKKGNKAHHVEIKPERKAHSHNYISTIKKKKEMETTNGKLAFRLFY